MKLNRKFYAKFLLISIIVCLISIFGTALIDTNFGSVITKDIKIVDSLGHDIGLTITSQRQQRLRIRLPA